MIDLSTVSVHKVNIVVSAGIPFTLTSNCGMLFTTETNNTILSLKLQSTSLCPNISLKHEPFFMYQSGSLNIRNAPVRNNQTSQSCSAPSGK